MKKNESTADRIIRIILGAVFIYFAYQLNTGIPAIMLYILAAIMFLTALSGYCCLYSLFGINTRKKK